MTLYRCNKADECPRKKCEHKKPHDPVDLNNLKGEKDIDSMYHGKVQLPQFWCNDRTFYCTIDNRLIGPCNCEPVD